LALFTPSEAAELLRLSKASIYRLVEKRAIPFYRVSGSLRFAQKDLEEYLARGRVEPVS
jgi:excisionase family DNA binding protein